MLSLVVLLSGISIITSILCFTAYKMWRLWFEDRHRQRLEVTAREFQQLDFQRTLAPVDSLALQDIESSLRVNGEKYQSSFVYDVKRALELRKARTNGITKTALAPVSYE